VWNDGFRRSVATGMTLLGEAVFWYRSGATPPIAPVTRAIAPVTHCTTPLFTPQRPLASDIPPILYPVFA
jgi:hypothetical protein